MRECENARMRECENARMRECENDITNKYIKTCGNNKKIQTFLQSSILALKFPQY